MAYQKLQAGKAFTVNPSDNTGLPDPGLKGPSGATTGTGGGGTQIIDANRTGDDINAFSTLKFTLAGVKPGMIAINTTDGTQSEVVQVVDETTIEVKDAIFSASPKNYVIYGGVQEGAVFYVGTGGDVKITTAAGDDVTFVGLPTGSFVPVQTIKIFNTGTTASNIIALW